MTADDECDYLVIGGGATGMAFSDTLLKHSKNDHDLRVIVVDKHESPGGQWHDSYDFVRLHQPSSGYGVESKELEPSESENTNSTLAEEDRHRAKRSEIIEYYADVKTDLESNHNFEFLGGTTLDLSQLDDGNPSRQDYTITKNSTGVSRTIRVRKRLVDARNLEPDLPVSTPPKFAFSSDTVAVLPVNDIAKKKNSNDDGDGDGDESSQINKKHFVVVGGGKTGMDAMYHLLTEKKILPENLLWVVPNDAWITAREKIGNCIDFLYASAKLHDGDAAPSSNNDSDAEEKKEADATEIGPDFFQKGFLEWEKQGHVYRLDPSVVPTKFKDATLSREELGLLQAAVPRIVRRGRISEITDRGSMVFADGSTMELPFPVGDTLFLHCSAGAFHCSKSHNSPPPIFEKHRIVVQDIYGTPGFCFVGSMVGKLESMAELSDEERNSMTRRPKPSATTNPLPLGKSDGDVIGAVSGDHPYIQRAHNLRAWLGLGPEVRNWLFANRLFHLRGADPKTILDKLDCIFGVLQKNGIVIDN